MKQRMFHHSDKRSQDLVKVCLKVVLQTVKPSAVVIGDFL